jgi:outer membrane usher protein
MRHRQRCAIVGVMLAALVGAGPAPAQSPSPARGDRFRPLEVRVNQTPVGTWTLLERNGRLYAPEEAFTDWRINRPPTGASIDARGDTWYALDAVKGFEAAIDEAEQRIELVFSPAAFPATRLTRVDAEKMEVAPVEPALFLNYDINVDHRAPHGSQARQALGALTELGLATSWGVLASSYAGQNLATGGPEPQKRTWRRLETSLTRNFMEGGTTLRLGDLNTRAGMVGRSLYFGGLQWSRNFSLQPGFISQPIPVLAGSSNAPSTVELYINNVLRQTTTVPTGPFTLDNVPVLAGAGQMRLVVRDILGRETVIEQPFFAHGALLETGLSDWSLEIGALRRNLGLADAAYAEKFGSALFRHGLSKTLTGEWRASGSRTQQETSIAIGQALLPWPALLQAGIGASRTPTGRGGTWLANLDWGGTHSGASLHIEGATAGYRGVGQRLDVPPARRQRTLNYRIGSLDWGSLGVSVARSTVGDGRVFTAASLGYSVRLGTRASLGIHVSGLAGPRSGQSVALSLSAPFGARSQFSSNATRQAGTWDGSARLEHLPRQVGDWGWSLLTARRGDTSFVEGGALQDTRFGALRLNASLAPDETNLRGGAQGALVWIDGSVFASRRVSQAFALVEVDGFSDVGVGVASQVETRTRAGGRALLTQLQAYRPNAIRLQAGDLPISAELDSLEMSVVPAARSAVKARFPVRSGRAALIRIVLDDGQPAPAGAEVRAPDDPQTHYVARRGEVFITRLPEASTVELTWKDQHCKLAVALPPGQADDITRVGPLLCQGVRR